MDQNKRIIKIKCTELNRNSCSFQMETKVDVFTFFSVVENKNFSVLYFETIVRNMNLFSQNFLNTEYVVQHNMNNFWITN